MRRSFLSHDCGGRPAGPPLPVFTGRVIPWVLASREYLSAVMDVRTGMDAATLIVFRLLIEVKSLKSNWNSPFYWIYFDHRTHPIVCV